MKRADDTKTGLRFSLSLLLLLWMTSTCLSQQPVTLRGKSMGTTWRIIVMPPTGTDPKTLQAAIDRSLEDLEHQVSHWDPTSLLSKFNNSDSLTPVLIPDAWGKILLAASQIHRQTQGAFDVTAAPLIDLWGFGPPGRRRESGVPSPREIQDALAHVGSDKLVIATTPAGGVTIRKNDPALRLDLSALAKGFAIDQMAGLLDSRSCTSYLVELGGELRGRGTRPDGNPWQVGLERPDPGRVGGIRHTIPLRDRAVATSGDYRNFLQSPAKGKSPLPHILDPRTGHPVQHGLASVTVIARTAMEADAWATALMVLGPQHGPALARRLKLAAEFVTRSAKGLDVSHTPSFARITSPQPPKAPAAPR